MIHFFKIRRNFAENICLLISGIAEIVYCVIGFFLQLIIYSFSQFDNILIQLEFLQIFDPTHQFFQYKFKPIMVFHQNFTTKFSIPNHNLPNLLPNHLPFSHLLWAHSNPLHHQIILLFPIRPISL